MIGVAFSDGLEYLQASAPSGRSSCFFREFLQSSGGSAQQGLDVNAGQQANQSAREQRGRILHALEIAQ